jgi:branched-subunit amino acid transport protein
MSVLTRVFQRYVSDELQKALYFPDISGQPLTSGDKVHTTDLLAGKVTIVTVLSSKVSEASILIPLSCNVLTLTLFHRHKPSYS